MAFLRRQLDQTRQADSSRPVEHVALKCLCPFCSRLLASHMVHIVTYCTSCFFLLLLFFFLSPRNLSSWSSLVSHLQPDPFYHSQHGRRLRGELAHRSCALSLVERSPAASDMQATNAFGTPARIQWPFSSPVKQLSSLLAGGSSPHIGR